MTADLSHLPANHPPVRIGKVGVLLVNLGTPDGTGLRVDAPLPQGIPEWTGA